MTTDHEQSGSPRGQLAAPPVGVFGKLLTIAAGIVVLVVAFMFSLVALGVVLIVGLLFFAYLKWKTRHLPRDLRDLAEQMQQQAARPGSRPQPGGRVIEGEVVRGNADEVAPESSTGSQQPNRSPTRDDG